MGTVGIDPDGVIAMSAATLGASVSLTHVAREIRDKIESVDHLVPGAPDVYGRATTEAEVLARSAGFAKDHALKYVDDVLPLKELGKVGYWLPDLAKLGWDPDK
ncbi:hypothetical protein ACH5WX_10535, partial [Nocardioides sp. CER28]